MGGPESQASDKPLPYAPPTTTHVHPHAGKMDYVLLMWRDGQLTLRIVECKVGAVRRARLPPAMAAAAQQRPGGGGAGSGWRTPPHPPSQPA